MVKGRKHVELTESLHLFHKLYVYIKWMRIWHLYGGWWRAESCFKSEVKEVASQSRHTKNAIIVHCIMVGFAPWLLCCHCCLWFFGTKDKFPGSYVYMYLDNRWFWFWKYDLNLCAYILVMKDLVILFQLANTEEYVDGMLAGNLGEVLIRYALIDILHLTGCACTCLLL